MILNDKKAFVKLFKSFENQGSKKTLYETYVNVK